MSIDLENDPIYKEITAARVKLLFERPFFGQLAARLVPIDASKWCPTAATDGKHFFYNREFIAKLKKGELLFLMGHEVLHCVYDHLYRRGGREPKLWNMANDYIVNWTLVDQKVGTMIKDENGKDIGLFNDKYTDEMSSEELYELLKKNCVTIEMTLDMHLDPEQQKKDKEEKKQQGKGQPGDKGEDGEEPGDGDGDGDQDGDGQGQGKKVKVTVVGRDGPPVLSEEDIENIRNDLQAAVIQTAQGLGADKVPAGIWRVIDSLVTPKMDWRALLDAHIRSSVKDDYTFAKISRRSYGTGMILPGQSYLDTIDIAIAIDTSGSMGEEQLRDIVSECKGIMQTFRDFKMKIWCFDGKVHPDSYVEYTPENIDDIDFYPLRGGGGTVFESNWEFMKEEGIEPTRFVMFTDGYPGGSWGEEDYCDTLFVIHGNAGRNIVAPFGITAYYEEKSDPGFFKMAA